MRQAGKGLTKAQRDMLQAVGEEIKRANERADTLAKLSEVGQALVSIEASPRKLKGLLRRVAQNAKKVLGADVVTVYQYVQSQKEFVLPPVLVGKLHEPDVRKDKVFKDDVVAKIVRRGSPLYSPDTQGKKLLSGPFKVERPERPEQRFVVREGIVSSAAVPLTAGDEVVGVMFVNYRSPQPFTEEQRETIESFATQAAVAIHNSRLYEQASQRADTLAKLNEIGQALVSIEASPRKLKGLLQRVAQNAKKVLGADVVTVYQYVQSREEFVLPPVIVGKLRDPFVPKEKVFDDDVVVKIVQGGNPLYSPDAQGESQLSDPFEVDRPERPEERFVVREGIVSSAAVPLTAGAEIVGVMFVNYRTPQSFGEEQREAIELFANQAAIAIHNSRLYEQASQRADTLAKLSEVGQALVSIEASPRELKRLLQRVAQNAKKVLGTDVVYVYQYIQDRDEFLVPPVRVGDLHHPLGPVVKVFDDDVVVKIVQGGSPLYSPKAQGEPQLSGPFEVERPERPEERFVVREGIVSSAAVPLKARDEIVGVMFVNYRSPQPFTEDQREAIELFANQAAVAIHNARLFELISRQDELQRAYTALEEEQEKRIAAEKLKALGQAAANLAHKMNNLGGIIPVCVQELREQVVVDDDVKENLDIIEHQAKLLLYAANDLLRPFVPSEESEFDVNVLVEDALKAAHPLLQDRIQVEFRCCEELPKVKTTKLLGDVFVELITNAAKAMPKEGKLEVETKLVDEGMIEVSFTDTGRGIPEKKQRWIFESFGAFEPELEEGQERPGIRFGLWWVKTFLQQQGGDVELRWSEVGKGSRFVVSHPVVS